MNRTITRHCTWPCSMVNTLPHRRCLVTALTSTSLAELYVLIAHCSYTDIPSYRRTRLEALLIGLHRITFPAPAEIRPNFHIRIWPPDMRPDMRSDLTIFRCICLTVFYKFGNLHLSVSSWACRSYLHPRFRLYFIAGYIVTLCDVPPAQEHSAPALAPAPAGFAIPNPAKSGPGLM